MYNLSEFLLPKNTKLFRLLKNKCFCSCFVIKSLVESHWPAVNGENYKNLKFIKVLP